MVYDSDFYVSRRPYSTRPTVSSYSVTTPRYYSSPRVETVTTPRREDNYTYSRQVTSESRNSGDGYSRPETKSYSSTTERRSAGGPGGYNYTTERTSTAGAGPGGYSYSSTTSGRLPHGTAYRHYSYRV